MCPPHFFYKSRLALIGLEISLSNPSIADHFFNTCTYMFNIHKMQSSLGLRNVVQRVAGRFLNSSLARPKDVIDPVQETALKERCFLVDINDKVIGTATKRECHTVSKEGLPLHRAFSVFLFNKKGDLLLQKRADTKITYPNCYTNSCCSHPIADVPGEEEETNALGVIRAAQRRLNYELGIDSDLVPAEKFNYLTRIRYADRGNGIWGEHEIDYILFLQSEVKPKPNPNEISEFNFVPKEELDGFLAGLAAPLTPWFQMILKYKLRLWWDNLGDLGKFRDHKTIHSLEL